MEASAALPFPEQRSLFPSICVDPSLFALRSGSLLTRFRCSPAEKLPWSSLAAFSQTCRTTHQVTAKLILRDGYLCSADGWHIHEESQPVKGLSSRLQSVKHLTVASPDPHLTVSTTNKGRCVSCLTQVNETAQGRRSNGGSYKAKPSSATIGWQLDMLKPKTLKSFS